MTDSNLSGHGGGADTNSQEQIGEVMETNQNYPTTDYLYSWFIDYRGIVAGPRCISLATVSVASPLGAGLGALIEGFRG